MDRNSDLVENIKYMKDLKERVRILEEQAAKRTMGRVDDERSSDETSGSTNKPCLPDIKARVCENNILFKIQCEKRKGNLIKIIGEVEKLNLTVVSTSVLPFGSSALDITVVAEMEKEFNLPVKDVAAILQSSVQDME